MVICLKFSKGKQKEFLLNVKSNVNCSWDNIAKKIGVHRQTIFVYLKESSMISEKNFKKLCTISKLNEINFEFKKIDIKNKIIKIKRPRLSKNLSEFIGAMAGDGHIRYERPHEVCIVAHKYLDKHLIEFHLYNLIKNLFNLEPKLVYQRNVVKVRVYSKKLCEFLINNYNLPYGKKKNKLHIPHEILRNELHLRYYLRGLFDTDGSFYRHHKNSACVSFISRDETFLKEVNYALKTLNFKISISGKNIYIYDSINIDRFFKEIGSKNLKNTLKYQKFIKEGKVPSTNEVMKIMHQ